MHSAVQEYYGRTLAGTDDLRTDACCDASALPEHLKPLLARIHPEVIERYYGCGLVAPPLLEGMRLLDLGCGSGRDVYLLAQLVGASGEVIGVDMTPEQLAVAEAHRAFQAEAFGYANVRFLSGLIEQLGALPLEPASFDVVVSNCVVNLSTDKLAVLRGVRRLLKPGGELYFADVYADRRVPIELQGDPVLYGECLGGALYGPDFLRLARQAGFADPRMVEERPLAVSDPELTAKLGALHFRSATYRLFAFDDLEETREDYGQTAMYLGTIVEQPETLAFDRDVQFRRGESRRVDGNTARMLSESRLAPHFELRGDRSRHRGPFVAAAAEADPAPAPACCG
ncbi:methyltransferase domain-containing protein [Cyanobium sp. Morenito 9A2]|uniref:methyltransferase domain-containing protein n=1 Tax=Cyanobium sp. Morenito 9A2 TaxID=2823718 RepID=UPI0020CE4B53|nr:methyltransferase domain-containing protein [Cyanobium sp. Morenito 9A2]MCP9850400.1 methyltransferase domain-containing protein [Cyanobium sp. Morenito 9A2]